MKHKTYTLLLDVDVTYIDENPWSRREDLAKSVQDLLARTLNAKVEVSCAEMDHGLVDDRKPEWRSFTSNDKKVETKESN